MNNHVQITLCKLGLYDHFESFLNCSKSCIPNTNSCEVPMFSNHLFCQPIPFMFLCFLPFLCFPFQQGIKNSFPALLLSNMFKKNIKATIQLCNCTKETTRSGEAHAHTHAFNLLLVNRETTAHASFQKKIDWGWRSYNLEIVNGKK